MSESAFGIDHGSEVSKSVKEAVGRSATGFVAGFKGKGLPGKRRATMPPQGSYKAGQTARKFTPLAASTAGGAGAGVGLNAAYQNRKQS